MKIIIIYRRLLALIFLLSWHESAVTAQTCSGLSRRVCKETYRCKWYRRNSQCLSYEETCARRTRKRRCKRVGFCEWQGGTCTALPDENPQPTDSPTKSPIANPTKVPTEVPIASPTAMPTASPIASPTAAPTEHPASEPTMLPDSSTPPTAEPTSSPMSANAAVVCPNVNESLVAPPLDGSINIAKSALDTVCTISLILPGDIGFVPIARSYDGMDWEPYSGEYASLDVSCSEDDCTFALDDLPSIDHSYTISTFSRTLSSDDVIARFLEQATFGTRRSDMAAFTSEAEWIKDQQENVAMTSHRGYFRQNANYRVQTSQTFGRVTRPCEQNTRYRSFAFTQKDFGSFGYVEFKNENGSIYLMIDGQARTVVSSIVGTDGEVDVNFPTEDGIYEMCDWPDDYLGSDIWLVHPTTDECCLMYFDDVIGNPVVKFDQGHPPTNEIVVLDGHAVPVDAAFYDNTAQEVILTSALSDSRCNDIPDERNEVTARVDRIVVGEYMGQYYLHDPRPILRENTLESPLIDGGGDLVNSMRFDDAFFYQSWENLDFMPLCANVPRTFLNDDSCVLSYEANVCTPQDTPDALFYVEPWAFYDVFLATGGTPNPNDEDGLETRYLYAIDNLVNGEGTDRPCDAGTRSRWRKMPDTSSCDVWDGFSPRVSSSTENIFRQLLEVSLDDNEYVRDIVFPLTGTACASNDVEKIDFFVQVGSDCYQNVHPDTLQAYDFTNWVRGGENGAALHPGGAPRIQKWAQWNSPTFFILEFPASHPMQRYYDTRDNTFDPPFPVDPLIPLGRLGDQINWFDLPTELAENPTVAAVFDAIVPVSSGGAAVVCGSPNEVANDPFSRGGHRGRGLDLGLAFNLTTFTRGFERQRTTVWTEIALDGPDQLRQRTAWALSQILVISPDAIAIDDQMETFLAYYDIFVRHAFGSYFDILKEVSYSPMMAEMLSYLDSKSTAYIWQTEAALEYADENFAREIMQLFSIGLYMLNDDGTPKTDANEVPFLSYTNADITEYARVWTGFTPQTRRGNTEYVSVDPMRIQIEWRDHFPKMGLQRVYIGEGEGTPLCSELLQQHFLKRGATYRLLGSRPKPELLSDPITLDESSRPALDPSSILYQQLCNPSMEGACQFHTKYVLPDDIDCTGLECDVDSLRLFSVDGMFFEYTRPPCLNLAFYEDPKVIETSTVGDPEDIQYMCGDASMPVASTLCCDAATEIALQVAPYAGERRTYDQATSLCALNNMEVCERPVLEQECEQGLCDERLFFWTNRSCQQQVKVNLEGDVAIVHAPSGETQVSRMVSPDTKVFFRVDWTEGNPFGSYDDACNALGCGRDAFDGLCLCNVSVSGSTVLVGNGSQSFRNPVHYIALSDPTVRDAQYETDAALRQYFNHPNTAPFLATRFAQRFGNSNPSPRYVQAIANAFTTGSYAFAGETFGDGEYGNLGATIACVLLDREARNVLLDADPAHGSLLEPFLKLTRLMRSLDFDMFPEKPYTRFRADLQAFWGQEPHRLPSVFSYFRPEYQPEGPVTRSGLTAPEGQVLTGPNVISFLNGIFSYLKYGLTDFYDGIGYSPPGWIPPIVGDYSRGYGANNFVPSDSTSGASVVSELATLLTSGRLSMESRAIIESAYVETITTHGKSDFEAMVNALLLMVTTPEFHSTGVVRKTGSNRELPPPPPDLANPYKAVVYVMLNGGMDSYSMLAPHTCSGSPSLREQYDSERGNLAFDASQGERDVLISASGQPCSQFALHDELTLLRTLYNDGDLLFMANTGVINQRGMDKNNYNDLTKTQLFAHNAMQDEIQKVDPYDNAPGTGILGRAADVLSRTYSVEKISINDPAIANVGVPGEADPSLVVDQGGPIEYNRRSWSEDYFDLERFADMLNGETELMSSIFGETWSEQYVNGVQDSKNLKSILDAATLSSVWDGQEEDQLWEKFSTVAKLIQQQAARKSERDMFFVEFGGWDNHARLKQEIRPQFETLNRNLAHFVQELKNQGKWDEVTVVVTSDFARTITGNSGEGSDHGWGGHYWMMGGSVDGGRIIGEYPSDITPDGPLNVGRGRIIPTTSWDSIWHGVVDWLGVSSSDMDTILPNRQNTVEGSFQMYSASDLFFFGIRNLRGQKK